MTMQRVSKNDRAIRIESRKRLFKEYYQLYFFIVPGVIYFLLFSYLPMYGVTFAFREFRFDKGFFLSPWIGFKYFREFFNYYDFWNLIRNTLTISFIKIVIFFPFPIILALMLNELKMLRLKKIVQTISYLPYFISWVVVVVILNQFISLDNGIFNYINTALGHEKIFYLNDIDYFYPIVFLTHAWKNVGFATIIYLSAIAGVDISLYESAIVDGAGRFRQMWHITLPSIAPTVGMLFILGLGGVLNAGWEQIFIIRTPGNMSIADILDTYVMTVGLRNGQYGYATAVNLFQSIIGLLLIVSTNMLSKKLSNKEMSVF